MVFLEDKVKEKVPDHHQFVGRDNSIKGFALFFTEIEHLFSIFKKNVLSPCDGHNR